MLEVLLLVFFPALMAYAAVSDMLTMTISNRVSLALIGGFPILAYAVGLPWAEIGMHFAAGFAMLAICFGMFARGWMGGGDAKLAAATTVWFGFSGLMDYALAVSLFGGALTLGLLAARKYPLPLFAARVPWIARLHDHKTGIPYGIALAAAALLVYPHTPLWIQAIGS